MKKYRNKSILLCLALSFILFLTGFSYGKSSVELRSEEPLIDLGTFVKDSPIGKEGASTAASGLAEAEAEESEETEDEEAGQAAENTKNTALAGGITVEITHDIITVNGQRCSDPKEALSQVKQDWRVGLKVYLVDNYAEYSTYKETYRLLRESSIQVVEKQS